MRGRLDLHEMTVIEARLALNHALDSLSMKYDELLVIHGYHGHILMDYVRKEYEHERIKRKVATLNPGDTLFLLKSREEMKIRGQIRAEDKRRFVLKSERLGFGRWSREDLSLAKNLWMNREVTRYLHGGERFTSDEILAWLNNEIEEELKQHTQFWPLFDRYKGYFLGCCGLHSHDKNAIHYEIGCYLLPRYWEMGYGQEACRKAIEYADEQLKARKLVASHHPKNERAAHLLDRLQFKDAGDEFDEATHLFFPKRELILR